MSDTILKCHEIFYSNNAFKLQGLGKEILQFFYHIYLFYLLFLMLLLYKTIENTQMDAASVNNDNDSKVKNSILIGQLI